MEGLWGWNLVGMCRVSGDAVMCGLVSVYMSVWLWERYEWRVHINEHDLYPLYCQLY